jgi:NAD(P) transhydrogenase subunit alpha
MSPQFINFLYFIGALCFILGIKGMTDPKTARLGNILKVEKVLSQLIPNLAEQVQMGSILIGIYIFFLAAFLGYHLITRVPPLLHTPLMSLTNAISAISIVGAMVIAGMKHDLITTILGTIAVLAASINVVGGYIITERTLRIFRGRGGGKK